MIDMDELERLRKNWHRAEMRNSRLEEENRRLAAELASGRAMSARDRLARHYRFQLIVSCCLPLLAPMIVWVGFPVWFGMVYAFFGLLSAVLNIIFMRYIRSCDFAAMSIVAALQSAVTIARRRKILLYIMGTLDMLLCGVFIRLVLDMGEPELVVAVFIGFFAGLAIAAYRVYKGNALVRAIKTELRQTLRGQD